MPGYRRPHTTAFAPSNLDGFDMLEKAFQDKQYRVADSPFTKSGPLEVKRHTIPTTYGNIPSSEESSAGSQTSGDEREEETTCQTTTPPHERFDGRVLRHTSGKVVTPPHLTRENSGLPPTPPTMANSDDAGPRSESLASNVQFADAVRNALHTQKSGRSTPAWHLPTPHPSPPGTSDNLPSTSVHSTHLHPMNAHHLRQYPSSRADSYHTAREDPSGSQLHLPQTPSPDLHPAAYQHLDLNRSLGFGDANSLLDHAQPTEDIHCQSRQDPASEASEASGRNLTPTPLQRRKQRPRSPYQAEQVDSDLDKHISYISDERFEEQASVENINNLVYQQIQEENVKRHSAITNDDAVPAGIFVPSKTSQEHKLRRTTKAQTLRNVSGSDYSQRQSIDSAPPRLRHKKATIPSRSLEGSPVVESSAGARRTIQQPALNGHGSGMTMLTRQAMGDNVKDNADGPMPRERTLKGSVDHRGQRIERQHTLRRSAKGDRLENHPSPATSQPCPSRLSERPGRRAPLERSPELKIPTRTTDRTLRHFAPDTKLENNAHIRRTSLETNFKSVPSSPRKSLDPRFLHPITTPMSTSQFSDRSEMEVCEAQGVNIYPHNNHSLLVVQHGSRPVSKDNPTPSPPNYLGLTNNQLGGREPLFSATIQQPSPKLGTANPTILVDSPLTNPRTAPEPPAFKVIPPTPSEELDRQLTMDYDDPPRSARPAAPQMRLSLSQRARRFSESFIEQPLFGRSLSLRKQPRSAPDDNAVRPTHLSPLWRPNYIWDGYDSEDEYDDDDIDGDPSANRLPQGGDTSDVENRKRSLLPRNMSVRMPGFRGQGGFLLGNSLGLDRHGTNSRRHHVVKKQSLGGMGSKGSYVGELRKRRSEEMLRQTVGRKGLLTLPFSGGKRVQYVGVSRLRERMSELRAEKEEREREKRRLALRSQIQHAR